MFSLKLIFDAQIVQESGFSMFHFILFYFLITGWNFRTNFTQAMDTSSPLFPFKTFLYILIDTSHSLAVFGGKIGQAGFENNHVC